MKDRRLLAVVIGASAGGLGALTSFTRNLGRPFIAPIVIVQHCHPSSGDYLATALTAAGPIPFTSAGDGDAVQAAHGYVAPAEYHLLIETDGRHLVLNADPPVRYARPSIDVLLESAADAYGPHLAALVLTGASADGTNGLARVRQKGGWTAVQDPDEAEYPYMPLSAMSARPHWVATVQELALALTRIQRSAPPP